MPLKRRVVPEVQAPGGRWFTGRCHRGCHSRRWESSPVLLLILWMGAARAACPRLTRGRRHGAACQSSPSVKRPTRRWWYGTRRWFCSCERKLPCRFLLIFLHYFFCHQSNPLASTCFLFSAAHIFTPVSFAVQLVRLLSAAEQLHRSRWRLSAFLKNTPRVPCLFSFFFFLGNNNYWLSPTNIQPSPSKFTFSPQSQAANVRPYTPDGLFHKSAEMTSQIHLGESS